MLEGFKNYQLLLIVLLTVIFVIGFLVMTVEYIKAKGLEGIRLDVYRLFLLAERKVKESGQGKQKMSWVIQKARGLLPSWLRYLISENLLKKVIQFWFDGIKDLLDDGKINNSCRKPEE